MGCELCVDKPHHQPNNQIELYKRAMKLREELSKNEKDFYRFAIFEEYYKVSNFCTIFLRELNK